MFAPLKIFCINLIEREDRYNFMKIQFEKIHNYPIEFVRNNKHIKGGRYGCFESHIQCIKMALKQNLDYCLVLEDDCVLAENFIEKRDDRSFKFLYERVKPGVLNHCYTILKDLDTNFCLRQKS